MWLPPPPAGESLQDRSQLFFASEGRIPRGVRPFYRWRKCSSSDMPDTIHVCVGTDQRMGRAERVLEHSIRKHTDAEVEMHWMRAGEAPWAGWASQPELPYQSGPGRWATGFSGFRFFVPELLSFEGFGIYMDADMLLLGDIAELHSLKREGLWCSVGGGMAVGVIDCSVPTKVPLMSEMLTRKMDHRELSRRVPIKNCVPKWWNRCDVLTNDTKLLHFTDMETQPWHPWPDRFAYQRAHRDKAAVDLFLELEAELDG